MQGWGIVFAAIAYLLFLFVVASYGDRQLAGRARHQKVGTSRSAIYALSLAIYCTSWTFFGSVGLASKSGLDFLAIYLGPVLMNALRQLRILSPLAMAKALLLELSPL